MTDLLPAALGAFVALAGVVGTVVVARWAKSGRVATSEAATLWEESSKIRADLRSDVVDLRAQLKEKDGRIVELERQVAERDARLADLERRVALLEDR